MSQDYLVIDGPDGEGELITVGDILNTLNAEQSEEYRKCTLCILQGKTAEKLMHHFNKLNISNVQASAIEYSLKSLEEAWSGAK